MKDFEKMGGFSPDEGLEELPGPKEENKEQLKMNEARINFLEGEEKKRKLNPAEEAELKARRETGDERIAFLESKKVEGKLNPTEEAELKARREKFEEE